MQTPTVGSYVSDTVSEQVYYLNRAIDEKTEWMEKVVKIGPVVVDIVGLFGGKGVYGENFREHLINFSAIWLPCQLLQRAQELFGKPGQKSCFTNGEPLIGVASKVIFAAGQVLNTVDLLNKWELITVSNVPLLSGAIDVFYGASAALYATERFIFWMGNKAKTKYIAKKLSHWVRGQNGFDEAYGATPSDAKRDELMYHYEKKIGLNQLKLQYAILSYTMGSKFETLFLERNKFQPVPNDEQTKVLAEGRKLLDHITKVTDNNVEKTGLLTKVNHFIKRIDEHLDHSDELRRLLITLSEALETKNYELAASESSRVHSHFDFVINGGKTRAQKIQAKIGKLYSKVGREVKIYTALKLFHVEELQTYFEWKRQKWTVLEMENDLRNKKALLTMLDMILKAVGSAMSFYTKFINPLKPLTDELAAILFRRECVKVGRTALGAFLGYAAWFSTEKSEDQLAAYKAALPAAFKNAEGKMQKPAIFVANKITDSVLETPITGDNATDQLQRILALAAPIMCRKYGDRHLRIPAAA